MNAPQSAERDKAMDKKVLKFSFEGVSYIASTDDFYETNRVRLPDGRIVAAKGWAERMPPIPVGLHEVDSDGTSVPHAWKAKQ